MRGLLVMLGGSLMLAACGPSAEQQAAANQAAMANAQQASEMAAKVDAQNGGDPTYRRMSDNPAGLALTAARALIFQGMDQPNGYTEPLLHRYRQAAKQRADQAEKA